MRKFLLALLLVACPAVAGAQTPAAMYCYQGPTNPQWAPCSATLPLQTTAVISGSVTVDTGANATAAAPSYSEGQVAAPISQNLTGDQRVIAKQATSPWATLDVNSAAILAGVTGAIPTGTNSIGAVTQGGVWTVGAALNAETTKVIGTVNQGTSPWVVSNGGTFATQASLTASATGAYSFSNIKTSTTTTVKSGAGTLHTVCVNTDGTVASAVALFDNTAASGTTIANINSLSSTNCYTYDIAFATGLTVVTTGTAPSDITISYK